MKVVVVAGGTGGHIYPAVAIINKIKEKEKDSEFLYIGTNDRMEKDIIPKMGIKFVGLEMKGLSKSIIHDFKVMGMFKRAVKETKKILEEFRPDIVIGAGGYITAPVLYAAHKLKLPILIHEQNSVPGKSNKFISSFANTICVSLPNSLKLFDKKKTVLTGNPRSEEIIKAEKLKKSSLGFSEDKKLVVIVMGSLGSVTMTKRLKEIITGFENKNYQVLIITGKAYFDDYRGVKLPSNVKLVSFMDNLINLLKDADLIVSRAGASTIAEITAIGLPAIMVPSPYVADNHQYKNAKELADCGACTIVSEEDFNKEVVIREIDRIFDNKEEYEKMVKASKSLGVADSASKIYDEIKRIIR